MEEIYLVLVIDRGLVDEVLAFKNERISLKKFREVCQAKGLDPKEPTSDYVDVFQLSIDVQ